MMSRWFESRFTGLFTDFGVIERRAHDPGVEICAGTIRTGGHTQTEMNMGGAGWTRAAAEAACLGEAIERLQARALPRDRSIKASFQSWPLDEPAVPPERWVLFHAEQYAQPGFPFQPLTRATECRWVCFREALSGDPWWVPEEFAFLNARPGATHRICPGLSTGLSCGQWGQPVVLRGLQEVIERDAMLGAWWGTYPLEEWDAGEIFGLVDAPSPRPSPPGGTIWQRVEERSPSPRPSLPGEGEGLRARLERPNLRWRFYRVRSPFSAHVTMVSLEGEDREGFCFSIGSACRETRAASWNKSMLEAVQGRHYVRRLKREKHEAETLSDFPDHAVYYSFHPGELAATVLHRPPEAAGDADARCVEPLPQLIERLGPDRRVLARAMTPPGLLEQNLGWHVWRVIVPGMQPLHGNARFAHLGGPLWGQRGLADWASTPPHPFP